jgi:hypothetical protein
LFAQSPFDGTWVAKLDTAQLPAKPDRYSLRNNMYECLTCVPKVEVKADGTDQKVTGHPYYDTIAVNLVNASSVEIIQKKDGKVMYKDSATLSSDGNMLDEKFTDSTGTQPITGEAMSKRVAPSPAGAHALSGSWHMEKFTNFSENGLTVNYQMTADGFKMSDLTGNSYDAKFDGKDYPLQGDAGHTMVSVKKIGPDTIEETDKRNGKVVGVSKMTVSKDGKSMKSDYMDKEHGTTSSFTLEKKS